MVLGCSTELPQVKPYSRAILAHRLSVGWDVLQHRMGSIAINTSMLSYIRLTKEGSSALESPSSTNANR
ncbi:hypothetical protein MLD38_034514 [Melastoma candidum]|uniref:Uncharacterized protein n=1 Tax=Melastoma candidum TaxID=119954 RepID=A0ACB9MAT1_9MYRT|nr:hypothetical protein MLD38_034514 [Melastoma candidum]